MDGILADEKIPEKTGALKLDVVYPMSMMSRRRDDSELRYSLRSLAAQPWAGNVYVIGHKPSWLRSAIHIQYSDQWELNSKDKNIIKKMLRACADPRISDPFVANSDDQYWLAPIDPKDMIYPPREVPGQMDRAGAVRGPHGPFRNRWIKRQFETVAFLKKMGRSQIRFDGHCPYLINKMKYMRTMAEIPWEIGEGFLIVVYHGWNFDADRNGYNIEFRDGVLSRIKKEMTRTEIEERTNKALFMNHNDKALGAGMREFLQGRFPNPSRWE